MEPLLGGEGSSGRSERPRGIFRRTDAISYGSNYEKAAALVDLAEDGVGLPEQILDSSSFQSSSRFYFTFTKVNVIWSLGYVALLVLNFLEEPLWCKNYTTHSCSDREYFFLGQLPYLTAAECLVYEGLALVVIIIHTFFPISYEGSHIYWKNAINLLKVFCLLVLVADMVVYAIYLSPAAFNSLPFRVAPYIRVILFILNIRELRETIIILSGMLGTYLNVLALGLLFLLFASWVAYVMFEDTIQGKTVFNSYGTTLYQLFVLFTTSNNPDVWVPAYKVSRWYCLYFILFVLLGVYFVTNLVLAVVYDSFKSELVKQVSETDQMKRRMLEKAFNILDAHNVGYLNKDQCIRLFEELNKYRTLPKIPREEFELIFDELDDSRDVKYSYELLMQHLHSTQSTTILGIINEHISFQVTSGQPSSISDDTDAVSFTGSIQDATNQINQKEILWGLFEDSLEHRDNEKGEGEAKEGENEESKKRSVDGGKHGGSIKKVKKDKAGSATGKSAKPEANTVSAAPRAKQEIPLPTVSTEVELSILEDLRNRIQWNSIALPSVNFYTFINTNNGLNCSSISHDGSLVAGGFSDSSVKVWDMAKIGQQPTNSLSQGENDNLQNEQMLGQNGGKRQYKLFQGHSGPVYAATFSPLGDFVLSSSADKTIRLWSTKLNANLVCYKGHNYPVWDVQFSPAGHYFASTSHDRTARIWSMDRIHPLRVMAGHLSDVDCVQWHPNCNYIATGSSDRSVRLWDVQSGQNVRVFKGHRSMILSLAISPDGRYMASGDEDGTIMMWDLSSGCCLTPLIGNTSCVWSLAFSCEGSLLASGSADCTLKFWDVTTGIKVPRNEEKSGNISRLRPLKSLSTKSTSVHCMQFSRRNLLFAAGAPAKSG